jgi:hypothetical protein
MKVVLRVSTDVAYDSVVESNLHPPLSLYRISTMEQEKQREGITRQFGLC